MEVYMLQPVGETLEELQLVQLVVQQPDEQRPPLDGFDQG